MLAQFATPFGQSLSAAHDLAADLKARWRASGDPDAAAALAEHPSLVPFKSVVLDLAYEEFCLREEAGAAPDPGRFCDRFPYRGSLRKVLDAHRLLAEEPHRLAPPVDWPAVGAAVEGLELIAVLGTGSFGRAYLAFDPGTNRACVLKLAKGRTGEARVVGPLDHPHVTGVYWSRVVDGRTAVCMPLLGVTTLAEVRDAAFPGPEAPRPADAILGTLHAETPAAAGGPVVRPGEPYPIGVAAIAGRIADALRYLHEAGVCHGDLKPSNVVLGSGGHPYLIDFNLSAGGDAPAGVLGGTLAYMAPEQLPALFDPGRTAAVDGKKADLYAFGVMIYELLTGRLPHSADTATGYDELVADRRGAPDLSALPQRTPAALARAVGRCLAFDPADRPADAAELAREIGAAVDGYRGRLRRWLYWLAVAAAVCLGAGVALGLWANGVRTAVAPPARAPASAEEFFAEGREMIRQEKWEAALTAYGKADRMGLQPPGRAKSHMAYAYARAIRTKEAAFMAERAIRAGDKTPAVLNLAGYLFAKLEDKDRALLYLEMALEADPGFRPALYNRALTHYQFRHDWVKAVRDIEAVLNGGPPTADICHNAARLYAWASASDPTLRPKALALASQAIRLGQPSDRLKNDLKLQRDLGIPHLIAQAEWEDVLKTPQGPADLSADLQLVDPGP